FLNGVSAWNIEGDKVIPQIRPYLDGVPVSDLRQLEIMITPHGFLRAALAASDATAITLPIVGPADFGLSQNGRKVTIVSFTVMDGKYTINGTINDQNLVELTDTWFPNPVYGDMNYEMRYTQYKDFNGVKFPTLFHVHQGDPRLNPAHNYYEIKITKVEPNVNVPVEAVPDAVRAAKAPPLTVQTQKLAEGVWMLGAANYNSLAMEFRDCVAVVEAAVNEARSLVVIDEINRLVPNKPVKYLVNTHHHFDHAGGLRTFLSQGTTIVTHETNKDYYLGILFHPGGWSLQPDRLAKYDPMYMISRRPAPIETVGGDTRITAPYVITDGSRMMEVFHVLDVAYDLGDPSYRQGNHSNDMLMQEAISRWSETAPYWEKHRAVIREMFAPVTQALIEAAHIRRGSAVLDIATGPGEPALAIAEFVGNEGKVLGIDPVPEMVEAARREADRQGLRNARFAVAQADTLPADAHSFEAIVSR